ncbi:MAG: DivIVA domain-containing protein [Deltaproteobacteria bacterium]
MRITALEVRSYQIKKAFMGLDAREVDHLKELASDAIEDATREITALQDRLSETATRLTEHLSREDILKNTITTAQSMVEDLKGNARKEAELIVAEARMQADEIVRQAHARASSLQEEIYRLKKQRMEIETQLKAVIDYHTGILVLEEAESKKADEEADKVKFLSK